MGIQPTATVETDLSPGNRETPNGVDDIKRELDAIKNKNPWIVLDPNKSTSGLFGLPFSERILLGAGVPEVYVQGGELDPSDREATGEDKEMRLILNNIQNSHKTIQRGALGLLVTSSIADALKNDSLPQLKMSEWLSYGSGVVEGQNGKGFLKTRVNSMIVDARIFADVMSKNGSGEILPERFLDFFELTEGVFPICVLGDEGNVLNMSGVLGQRAETDGSLWLNHGDEILQIANLHSSIEKMMSSPKFMCLGNRLLERDLLNAIATDKEILEFVIAYYSTYFSLMYRVHAIDREIGPLGFLSSEGGISKNGLSIWLNLNEELMNICVEYLKSISSLLDPEEAREIEM